jgi:hypothetical protein
MLFFTDMAITLSAADKWTSHFNKELDVNIKKRRGSYFTLFLTV